MSFAPVKPTTPPKNLTALCYHCGGSVLQALEYDDKTFCCQGCQNVYEILQENQLDQYYRLENKPGLRLNQTEDYAYLDQAQVAESLYQFIEGPLAKISLFLPAIHCSSCIWLLENLHRLSSGVIQSQVHFGKKQADVLFNHEVLSLSRLAQLLQSIGYPPNFSLAQKDEAATQAQNQNRSVQRSLSYKIALSGFVFGNSMLFSFPDYLALDASLLEDYQGFFNLLNFLLALPIVFYASSDYFRAAWNNLKHRTLGIDVPLALGIFALFFWSSYEIASGLGTGYFDSLAGLLFFLLVGRWYQHRSFATLSFERDYRSYFPLAATRILEDGRTEVLPLAALLAGHRLRIRNQELIPADAWLCSEEAAIDYSFVSGESQPAPKKQGDKLYAGGRQIGPAIEVEVRRPVEQSYLTKLWNASPNKTKHQLSELLHRAGTVFTLFILLAALGALVYWLVQGQEAKALLSFVSVLIIACPCALALSMPYAFGNVLRLMGRRGLYLKQAATVEALAKVDTLVFDKTGTLTQSGQETVHFVGSDLRPEDLAAVRSLVRQSTHPLSRSLDKHLEAVTPYAQMEGFKEHLGLGLEARLGGRRYRLGSAAFTQASMDLSLEGPQSSRVYLEVDGLVLGCFVLTKAYRVGLEALFAQLKAKYPCYLLSGDTDAERPKLEAWFEGDKMYFNQSPQDKKDFIEALQAKGHRVLMLGDGLNDAGALQAAELGMALAEDVHSFTPASDAILASGELVHLAGFLRLAKRSVVLLRLSFLLSLSYNFIGLSFALRGLLTPLIAAILMPLSSVSVVVFVVLGGWFLAWRSLPVQVFSNNDLGHLKG